MKKLLLLVAIATISFGSFAQNQFGLKLGYNSSKITTAWASDKDLEDGLDDMYEDVGSLGGMYVGLVFTKTSDGFFSFQQELAFSQRGVKNTDTDAYYRYNYIDIKPLFNFGGGADNWRAYVQVGPSINFWLSKAMYDKDGKYVDDSDEWLEDSDDEGMGALDIRAELGFVLGAGFKYQLGPGWVLVNPRYEWGISPKTIVDLGGEGFSEVNRTFTFNVGYLYEF